MLKVKLIAHTPDPEKIIAAAARFCYSPADTDTIMEKLTDDATGNFINMLMEIGHESPIEHASFTFAIEGVSRSLLAQITRHRIASFSVQSQRYVKENHFALIPVSHSEPHHVEADSFLVQTLSKVYEGQTGEKAELIAIGGGTYARSLEAGVAFGPLFPGREDIAHQKDEYMYIEDLFKATALYAEAIYELAK